VFPNVCPYTILAIGSFRCSLISIRPDHFRSFKFNEALGQKLRAFPQEILV
jgi:hypothetical protein